MKYSFYLRKCSFGAVFLQWAKNTQAHNCCIPAVTGQLADMPQLDQVSGMAQ